MHLVRHARVPAGGKGDRRVRAFKNHLAYLPHSGSVFGELADDLAGYESTPGSLHFPIDQPLPKALVKKLIATRLKEVRGRASDQGR